MYSSFRNYLTVAHLIKSYPSSIEPQKSVHEIKHDVIVDTQSTNGNTAESEGGQTPGTMMSALKN